MSNDSHAKNALPHEDRATRALLRSIFTSLPAAHCVWDATCQPVLTNPAFDRLFATTSYADFCEQRDPSSFIASALQGQARRVGPLWCAGRATAVGDTAAPQRAIVCTFTPLADEHERYVHVLGTFVDVTDQLERDVSRSIDTTPKVTNDQGARVAEERLRFVVDNAPVAFFALDHEGRYTCLEGQRLKRLGIKPSDLLGRSAFEVEVNSPENLVFIRRGLRGESLTFRGDSIAGGKFECRCVPSFDADGRVTGLSGITYDVTDQDRAEQALRESEEHLRQALVAGRLMTMELDLKTGSSRLSSNAGELFGASHELLTIQSVLDLLHPDDVEKAQRALAHGAEHGVALPDVQYRAIRPDNGETVWLERRLHYVRNDAGEVVCARGLLIDVSARVRAEELTARSRELLLENKRIAEADRLKSHFLATMSHELRTPLNAVIGFAELLHDRVVDPSAPAALEFLGHILSGGRHLLRLIDELLDIAKMEAGKQEFRPEPVELASLIADVCLLVRGAAERKNTHVALELDPALTDIELDPTRFKQVLFNYLSNALRFTEPNGIVTVRTIATDASTFRLEVEDNGPGIPPADLGRLFREFQQLEPSVEPQHGGTGLGLMLTRVLVEAQGGTVGVRSIVGVGSTFTATLPRKHLLKSTSLPAARSLRPASVAPAPSLCCGPSPAAKCGCESIPPAPPAGHA